MRPKGPGATLGDGLEVVGLLRRGTDLDVYDAWDDARGCRVVVKTLRPDRLDDADARERLLHEGRLLCRLAHPHLVRGYEVRDGRRPAVVLETLHGTTLSALADDAPLERQEAAVLGLHLASALAHLHGEGLLHLDVKPSNVVAEAGRAKLLDLSIARPPGRARPGLGTWGYLAPEQERGDVLTAAADVWGLGATLQESTAEGVLDALIDACLQEDPARRPALPALTRALEAEAGVSLRPSPRRRSRSSPRNERRPRND